MKTSLDFPRASACIRVFKCLSPGILALASFHAGAAPGDLPLVTSSAAAGGAQNYSVPVQTLLVLTSLTFLPAMVLLMTGFTRIVIVLSLLRSALGTQASPPNPVIIGLSLFLTMVVMSPVIDQVERDAWKPLVENRIGFQEALARAEGPMKGFMLRQTRDADLALFARLARTEKLPDAKDMPLRVVVPAFVTSELKTAFQIGFVIFIPFLIIDLVVSSVLMSMGMMMMSPMLVSLPFKLILFVLADGWNLLLGSLVASFG